MIKPRTSQLEFELSAEHNVNLIKDITITIEKSSNESVCSSSASSSSLSLTNALINGHFRSSSGTIATTQTVSEVWKNRTFENSVTLPDKNKS